MNIFKFKKEKGNTYTIYFDNYESIKLYDDVIINYNLLINKNINDNLYDEIIKYNNLLDGYYKSIKYINKKLRTELEIRKYLEKNNNKNIDYIVELLYKNGYLNKKNYIISYINDQHNLTINGPIKIKNELVKLGYDEGFIEKYLCNKEWNERIDKILQKKIRINNKMSNNALKNKIINDIIVLGYEKKDILDKLDDYVLKDDYDILKNELIRVKSKYSKKYIGKELELKVCHYLYSKGFNLSDIKRCYSEI